MVQEARPSAWGMVAAVNTRRPVVQQDEEEVDESTENMPMHPLEADNPEQDDVAHITLEDWVAHRGHEGEAESGAEGDAEGALGTAGAPADDLAVEGEEPGQPSAVVNPSEQGPTQAPELEPAAAAASSSTGPGQQSAAEAVVELGGLGRIAYYPSKGAFEATCTVPGHVGCVLTRTA